MGSGSPNQGVMFMKGSVGGAGTAAETVCAGVSLLLPSRPPGS